jgi:hypothetical protein
MLLTLHARAARDRRRHARRGGTRRRVTVARAPVRGGANGARRSRTTECCADHGRDPRRVIRRGLGTDAAILGVFCVVNFARTTGRSSACSARRDLRRVLRLDLRADHGRDRRRVLCRELRADQESKSAIPGAFFVASFSCTKGLIHYAFCLRAELELGLRGRLRLELIALSYFINIISLNNISGGPGVTLETSRRLVYFCPR